MRTGFFMALFLTCLAPALAARAEGPDADAQASDRSSVPEDEALAARVDAVLKSAEVDAVRAPAEQAKLALARARTLRDAQAQERSLAIARAALALAEARALLLRERALWSAATRRGAEAKERAEKARRALADQKAVPSAKPEGRGP
jgi:hypothetical protein